MTFILQTKKLSPGWPLKLSRVDPGQYLDGWPFGKNWVAAQRSVSAYQTQIVKVSIGSCLKAQSLVYSTAVVAIT